MEANDNNSGSEFHKHKSLSFPENSNSSRDGASSSNNGGGSLHETQRKDDRRDYGKNRERSRNGERNPERAFHGKSKDNFRDEENRAIFPEEQPQNNLQPPAPQQFQTPFASYNYKTADNTDVDSNRRPMCMMPYNMIPMTPQWGNPMDSMTITPTNMPVNISSSAMPMTTGMDITQSAGPSMNQLAYMNMSGEHNMFGMLNMTNYCPYNMMSGQENVVGPPKEIIRFTKSVLYPPNPNAPLPSTRGKPLGCKTVYVGGLPDKANEEIMMEIFEKCGEILAIRMNKKHFCHIRYGSEEYVEYALRYSGYRIKIENKDDAPYTGRLHVDYADGKHDQYEYECQQRALQREACHRERMEQDLFRTPTPPPVVHYSEHEATALGEKLRGEDTFQEAVSTLITWLERGECTKRNASSFYSMIQSTNSHVRRLLNEKSKYEDELNKAKLMLQQQMHGILLQFTEIVKVFKTASLQKVWDHFTKAQRKHIELWKKQAEEIKNAHVEEVLNERIEDEMDLSEDEANDENTVANNEVTAEVKCSEEIDALRCQLKAFENETSVMKAELNKVLETIVTKEQNIQDLKCALRKEAKEKENMSLKRSADKAELKELKASEIKNSVQNVEIDESDTKAGVSSSSATFDEKDAYLICLISAFLNVHPFGANIDYICSYLQQENLTIQPRDVENLMKSLPSLFREDSTGIGASLGKKWKYLGFGA